MGIMVDFLKHEVTTDRERGRLKMSVKTLASWNAHAQHTAWDAICQQVKTKDSIADKQQFIDL